MKACTEVTRIRSSLQSRVERALAEIRIGRMVLVVDDEDRENEGDLILAAELATPEAVAFMIRHTSRPLCIAITNDRAAYCSTFDGLQHAALVRGDADQRDAAVGDPRNSPVLVRVHSECLTGDVFRSRRCDCGERLTLAMARIGAAGRSVLVYLRGHEGRGIGLAHKLRACCLPNLDDLIYLTTKRTRMNHYSIDCAIS